MNLKNDSELIYEVQNGNKDSFNEIMSRYEPLIASIVGKYLRGELFGDSDRDDLLQEASIALYNAVMSYDISQSEVTFGLYAKICLSNSLNSASRQRKRQRKADDAQISGGTSESSSYGAEERISDAGLLLDRVDDLLSDFEKAVFRLFIRGYSHKFIAETLGRTEKSVDNAIFRIRSKISSRLLWKR